MNASSLCMFHAYAAPEGVIPEYLEALTGNKFTQEKVHEIGHRIYLMRHAFNLREGLKPSDFDISDRSIGVPPQTEGPLEGVTVEEETISSNFFKAARIDMESGNPERELMEELGHLDAVIDDLYGVTELS